MSDEKPMSVEFEAMRKLVVDPPQGSLKLEDKVMGERKDAADRPGDREALSMKLTLIDEGQEYIYHADVSADGVMNLRGIHPYLEELPAVKFSVEGNNVNIEIRTTEKGKGS